MGSLAPDRSRGQAGSLGLVERGRRSVAVELAVEPLGPGWRRQSGWRRRPSARSGWSCRLEGECGRPRSSLRQDSGGVQAVIPPSGGPSSRRAAETRQRPSEGLGGAYGERGKARRLGEAKGRPSGDRGKGVMDGGSRVTSPPAAAEPIAAAGPLSCGLRACIASREASSGGEARSMNEPTPAMRMIIGR